ncbi:MAG: hypothetical protein BGO12_08405 [Verrucomicrobia bacterium 61-8]|nr:MAG: hypothetical protein BGO12_08405 [Verrucomicrobia bacterium 61-8]
MVGYVDETSDKSVTSQDLSILKIQAILPGELSVIAFSKRLCSLRDGRLIKAQAGGLITDSYFHEFFRDISLQLCLEVASIVPDSEGAKAFKRNPSPRLDWAMHYVHVVNKLLLGMADISHGGCILILDRVLEDPLNAPIMGIKPPKYRTKNGELWEMMKGYCILQEQEPEDEPFLNIQTQISEVTNRIDSYVESILKLTGIDGAVVLDRQLAVVAFGAIIDAKELPATVNVQTGQLHNMADFRHVDLKRFGTRHGSAARFAYHTGGMAIVTSHDGGVKMIRRKDEALVILNDASFDLDLEL